MTRAEPPIGDGGVTVGSFTYVHTQDRWVWSDAVAAMHGYAPGAVEPTTDLVLAHKHPDDRATVTELIDRVRAEGAVFSSRHRIVDVQGRTRVVVVIGERMVDDDGVAVGTRGFYVDITDSFDADVQRSVTRHVTAIEKTRSTIQQAVGMIRMAYGVSAERAFDVLKWRSQERNVKLRSIAERLVADVSATPLSADARARLDHFLLSADRDDGG